MSVQRWDVAAGLFTQHPTGGYVTYADHARIVAEAAAQAREAAYREMTDERHSWPGPRGFDYDKGYEQGKADAEQAHATALAAVRVPAWQNGYDTDCPRCGDKLVFDIIGDGRSGGTIGTVPGAESGPMGPELEETS